MRFINIDVRNNITNRIFMVFASIKLHRNKIIMNFNLVNLIKNHHKTKQNKKKNSISEIRNVDIENVYEIM